MMIMKWAIVVCPAFKVAEESIIHSIPYRSAPDSFSSSSITFVSRIVILICGPKADRHSAFIIDSSSSVVEGTHTFLKAKGSGTKCIDSEDPLIASSSLDIKTDFHPWIHVSTLEVGVEHKRNSAQPHRVSVLHTFQWEIGHPHLWSSNSVLTASLVSLTYLVLPLYSSKPINQSAPSENRPLILTSSSHTSFKGPDSRSPTLVPRGSLLFQP
ncbi:hypothetical protein BD324DRAFT_294851 [Kockovaella imperatae]|uniref:Uncharacterized protein n=1 Tax=Kockovaella imperatae TaxID=4999 RepID=A0A1Y1ULL0_9TREE|nr:hypothetical protein BD324DRAFT_294851 [Kockovaella imperatae]ORX38869.1 hypothetical protein BD324DRAFT_294851 [Kockovaella imperatae]